MNTADYIALLIAAFTAIPAIYLIVNNFRKVKVNCEFDVMSTPEYETVRMLSIVAVSSGQRPITIKKAGLIMSNNQKLFTTQLDNKLGKIPLPKLLNYGEHVCILLDVDVLLYLIEKQKMYFKSAFVCDAEGKCYTAKLPKDLKNFMKLSHNR